MRRMRHGTDNKTTATMRNAVNRYLPVAPGKRPTEGHAVVLDELNVKGARNPGQPLRPAVKVSLTTTLTA